MVAGKIAWSKISTADSVDAWSCPHSIDDSTFGSVVVGLGCRVFVPPVEDYVAHVVTREQAFNAVVEYWDVGQPVSMSVETDERFIIGFPSKLMIKTAHKSFVGF